MSDKPTIGSRNEKKPYIRPELRQVTLKAEMVVVVGCKNATHSGPNHSTCCATTNCKAIGS
jgi:hypothetical protein